MRILDKYILKETIMTFIFGICAFSAVFLGSGTLLRIAQYITQYGASFSAIVRLIIYSLPGIIVWTFPMSMLLAALLTFGRLSGNSEIIAMKACGVSFKRLVTPVIAFSLGVSIFSIGFNEYVVPASNQAYADLVRYEIQGNIIIHHMNPITPEDIINRNDDLLNPEYLISTVLNTHNAIHYGDSSLLPHVPVERRKNDMCPWRH